jgi:hypothetical protein
MGCPASQYPEDASWKVGVLPGDGDGEILIMPISTQCFFGAVM